MGDSCSAAWCSVTGDLLKEMANSFWNRMPQSRYHISQKFRHGEAAGVNRMQLELDLADLRSFLDSYPLDDIYIWTKPAFSGVRSQIEPLPQNNYLVESYLKIGSH